jgi:hypothetical protein
MNFTLPVISCAVVFALNGVFLSASGAVVFTSDTTIHSFDTGYDGADILVNNCTLTVDGPHTFASLEITPGATLTHSFSGGATVEVQRTIVNEPHLLIGTNAVSLLNTGIVDSVTASGTNAITSYTNGVDYVVIPLTNGLVELERTPDSSIPDGGTVLVSYTLTDLTPTGLMLVISGDVTVASAGSINVDGGGYSDATGPGAGQTSLARIPDGSGGGYGGNGGSSSSNAVGGVVYGAFDQPTLLGSGGGLGVGGFGGAGGGLVHMVVGGHLQVDGIISANGAEGFNDRSGGGAGGSIWLSTAGISGAGTIRANGGAGDPVHGGGGGGGRIAIASGTNLFTGSILAQGGPGWQAGGAGTIYTSSGGQPGLLLVDNGGQSGTNTPLAVLNGADVLVRGNGQVSVSAPWTANNVIIESNGWLTALPLTTLTIAAASVTVEAGGGIVADAAGYGPGSGPGSGSFGPSVYFPCAGGGYGGFGGKGSSTNAWGGVAYGHQRLADAFGSGGGDSNYSFSHSGSGGGAINLNARALRMDGLLSANGGNGSARAAAAVLVVVY